MEEVAVDHQGPGEGPGTSEIGASQPQAGGQPADTRPMGLVGADFSAALALARAGEPAGFAALYRAYNRAVAATVRSGTRTDAAAGSSIDAVNPTEAVNRIFVKAFRLIDRFVGTPGDFCALLYRLSVFEISDRQRLGDGAATGDRAPAAAAEPGASTALRSLTPDQRELVVLRVYFHLSSDEVAAVMDRSSVAIQSLQNRADARLRLLAEPTQQPSPGREVPK